jgi:hypothetical protein
MDKSEQKHRKKLNAEQLEVLELLYKFRFGSNDLIAQYFGKKDRSFVFKRLSILLEQGLIGKRFEPSYRLAGKPAAYFLTPAGARILQESNSKIELNIKTIYKDKTVSEQFIKHCLAIFAVHNHLRAEYGGKLKFFTKSQLAKYDYLPPKLPDAYIRLKVEQSEKQFFLDVFHDDQPFFAAARRIKQYVDYSDEGEWEVTGTELPTALLICESAGLQKLLQKKVARSTGEVIFALTTLAELTTGGAIWQQADEPEEPKKVLLEL